MGYTRPMKTHTFVWYAVTAASMCLWLSCSSSDSGDSLDLSPSLSKGPPPLCGIVLWQTNPMITLYKDSISLEFSYFYYSDVANDDPSGGYRYDWTKVDTFLTQAKGRGHHGIVRFRDTDPELGLVAKSLPDSLWVHTRQADYDEGIAGAAKKRVVFPDWSNPDLPAFISSFYQKMAERYPDQSNGLGYVEVGFGFWAEYHIDFDNLSNFSHTDADTMAEALGRIFPSRADQVSILTEVSRSFVNVPWGISVDAGDTDFGPYAADLPVNAPAFGIFDDSLLHEEWNDTNWENWKFFEDRIAAGMNGGEFSYYTDFDQAHALDSDGPHGLSLAEAARRCNLSFVIGDGQTAFANPEALARAGGSLGYALRIEDVSISEGGTEVTIKNYGAATVPYHMYASFGPVSSTESLKGLRSNDSRTLRVAVADPDPATFILTSPVLLEGQVIPYSVE